MVNAEWDVQLSKEVEKWFRGLNQLDRLRARRAIHLLETRGPYLGMPHSKSLGEGLLELRFTCEDVHRRITYYFDPTRRAITLTTFRKQRQNEQNEVKRAKQAMLKSKRQEG